MAVIVHVVYATARPRAHDHPSLEIARHVRVRGLVHRVDLRIVFAHRLYGLAEPRKTSYVRVGCANPLLTAHSGGAKAVEAGEACFSAELRSRSRARSNEKKLPQLVLPLVAQLGALLRAQFGRSVAVPC